MKLRKEILMRIAISKKEIENLIKNIDESFSEYDDLLKKEALFYTVGGAVAFFVALDYDKAIKLFCLMVAIQCFGVWLRSPKRDEDNYSPAWIDDQDKLTLSKVVEEANEALKSIGKETVVVDLEQSLHQILKQLVKLEEAIDKFYYPEFKYPSTFTKHNLFSSTTNQLDDENNEAVNNMIKSFHHGR